jgi:hypothetical protein
MTEIALHVAAEFVVFVLCADHAARLAFVVRNNAADENTAIAPRIFTPQLLLFLAVHEAVEIDCG